MTKPVLPQRLNLRLPSVRFPVCQRQVPINPLLRLLRAALRLIFGHLPNSLSEPEKKGAAKKAKAPAAAGQKSMMSFFGKK